MSSQPPTPSRNQLDPVILAQLYEIARAVVEPGPELERRIDERVTVLAASVGRALTVLAEESPTPTTEELWESAIGPALHYVSANHLHAHTSNELWRILRVGSERRLRDLPERLLRAFLVAHSPKRKLRLDSRARVLLEEHLRFWVESFTWEDYEQLHAEELDDRGPPLGYRSDRELQLDAIMSDKSRPQAERIDAAEQLAKIEEKRREDSTKKLDLKESPGALAWAASNSSKFLLGRECRKHKIRGCSQCQKRKGGPALTRRYEALAQEEGWKPEELKAPTRRGKPSPAETSRLDALGRVAATLRAEGFTLDDIGTVMDRPRQRVYDLLGRAA